MNGVVDGGKHRNRVEECLEEQRWGGGQRQRDRDGEIERRREKEVEGGKRERQRGRERAGSLWLIPIRRGFGGPSELGVMNGFRGDCVCMDWLPHTAPPYTHTHTHTQTPSHTHTHTQTPSHTHNT